MGFNLSDVFLTILLQLVFVVPAVALMYGEAGHKFLGVVVLSGVAWGGDFVFTHMLKYGGVITYVISYASLIGLLWFVAKKTAIRETIMFETNPLNPKAALIGMRGEEAVKNVFDKYSVPHIHDLFLPIPPGVENWPISGATQIDHVADFGVFLMVVETKTWQGADIYGSNEYDRWIRDGRYHAKDAPNTSKQNELHCEVVRFITEEVVDIENVSVIHEASRVNVSGANVYTTEEFEGVVAKLSRERPLAYRSFAQDECREKFAGLFFKGGALMSEAFMALAMMRGDILEQKRLQSIKSGRWEKTITRRSGFNVFIELVLRASLVAFAACVVVPGLFSIKRALAW